MRTMSTLVRITMVMAYLVGGLSGGFLYELAWMWIEFEEFDYDYGFVGWVRL